MANSKSSGPTHPVRAGIYVRISQDAAGRSLGVKRQREDCLELAQQLGWEIVETYSDNDVSATAKKPRPAYRRMLADIESGRITAFVAWHPDRVYRRVQDLTELIEIVKQHNTQIATVRAGHIDLTTPAGRMTAGVVASVNVYEGEAKADRWRRSWQQGREAGEPARTGSRLYGYTRGGDLIPHEKTIAQRMATDILAGRSILHVSRWLEAEGITSTRGNPWRPAGIKRYLTNPRIAGWSTLKGEIVAQGQWEPILDQETWQGIRALLEARTRAYVPRKALLLDLIFCELCGHRLITSSMRGKRTYRCPDRPGMGGCGHVSGNAEPIEEHVERYARARIADPDVRVRITALRAEPSGAQAEIAQLELRINELEQQLDQPGTPVTTILRAIERTKARQADLLNQVAAVPRAAVDESDEWPTDLLQRHALISLVVEKVTMAPTPVRGRRWFDTSRLTILPR